MKDPARTFMASIDALARQEGLRTHEAVRLYVDMAFLALRGTALTGENRAKNESAWHERVDPLQDRFKARDHAARAMGVMRLALLRRREDFLGPIFMETNADPRIGQFFTPPTLCDLIAKIVGPTQFPATIHEPAAGVGAMMLALAQTRVDAGGDPALDLHFTAVELNVTTARACYVQMALAGLSADIQWGDSLRLHFFDEPWQTPVAAQRRRLAALAA